MGRNGSDVCFTFRHADSVFEVLISFLKMIVSVTNSQSKIFPDGFGQTYWWTTAKYQLSGSALLLVSPKALPY